MANKMALTSSYLTPIKKKFSIGMVSQSFKGKYEAKLEVPDAQECRERKAPKKPYCKRGMRIFWTNILLLLQTNTQVHFFANLHNLMFLCN